ncbi:MAG: MBL fold metallo-hydrolase [Flavobacteriaceae bacterium]|nr:MBL fold metallo-hydrolase [Flavobacteriaceae bacterium]
MPVKYIVFSLSLFVSICGVAQKKESSKEATQIKAKEQFKNISLVKDSIYVLKNRGGNIGLSIGKDGIYMIDSQFENISEENLEAIRLLSDKPIRLLVNTHHHGDHTGGNDAFKMTGAMVIAHDNVTNRLQRSKKQQAGSKRNEQLEAAREKIREKVSKAELEADPKKYERMAEEAAGDLTSYMEDVANVPTITFEKALEFNFNEKIDLIHVQRAHTDGDVIVHFTESNVIHTGDVFFAGRYPYIDLNSRGSVDGAITALGVIANLADEQTLIIPGHGDISTKQDVKASLGMLRYLRDTVAFEMAKKKRSKEEIMAMRSITSKYDQQGFGDGFITTEKMLETLYLDYLQKHNITEDSMD